MQQADTGGQHVSGPIQYTFVSTVTDKQIYAVVGVIMSQSLC
jgi:hypothetical protein